MLTINPSWSRPGVTLKSKNTTTVPEYFNLTWEGNGFDHMNFYLSETGVPSVLKAGNEIGIYDGPNCVGAAVIQNTGEEYYSF